jgi:deazaflavin-dependent oxidoreductase (nitroreductase family)
MAEQFAYVTTIGRKSGLPREIEIWFVEADDMIYILAEHGERANWVRNIRQNNQVKVRIGGHTWSGTARVLHETNDAGPYLKARDLSQQKYGWGDGLPVEIRLG